MYYVDKTSSKRNTKNSARRINIQKTRQKSKSAKGFDVILKLSIVFISYYCL